MTEDFFYRFFVALQNDPESESEKRGGAVEFAQGMETAPPAYKLTTVSIIN